MPEATTQSQPPPELDPAVKASIEARQQRRRAKEAEEGDGELRPVDEVMKAAAKSEKLEGEEVQDALEVFFAEEGDEDAVDSEPKPLKVNVGSTKKPRYVRFIVNPIDEDVIKDIRKRSRTGTKAQIRRGEGEVDENLVARRIVAKATVEPDFKALAGRLGIRTGADDAVQAYFRKFKKTGLILGISGEILGLSGYDEDDVSELDAAGG